MTAADTGHKHMFPLEKPGVFGKTGPCECGLTREQALAASRGRDLGAEEGYAEWRGWLAAQDYNFDDDSYQAEAFAAGMQAGRDLAHPIERERNILRGQLEHAELTITDYLNALTALRAAFDRTERDLATAASPGTPVYLATITHLAAALRDIRDANPNAPAGAYVHDRASLALRTLPPSVPRGFAGVDSLRDALAAEIRTCYCGTTATVVPGVFPHSDCDGSAVRSARADEFARVKIKLCALVASLDETVTRGTHAEEFDQGAAHASAVTARQISAILDETAMRANGTPVPTASADENGVVTMAATEAGNGDDRAKHRHEFPPGIDGSCECGKSYAAEQVDDSGGSASVAVPVLNKLLQYQPLAELTDDPAEWADRARESGRPMWQNIRDSRAISEDGGKTYWLVSDRNGTDGKPVMYQAAAKS